MINLNESMGPGWERTLLPIALWGPKEEEWYERQLIAYWGIGLGSSIKTSETLGLFI